MQKCQDCSLKYVNVNNIHGLPKLASENKKPTIADNIMILLHEYIGEIRKSPSICSQRRLIDSLQTKQELKRSKRVWTTAKDINQFLVKTPTRQAPSNIPQPKTSSQTLELQLEAFKVHKREVQTHVKTTGKCLSGFTKEFRTKRNLRQTDRRTIYKAAFHIRRKCK